MKMRTVYAPAALLMALLAGCSKETTAPARPSLSIVPADGAGGVRLDASVVLDFGAAVDRATVERSFHLLPEGSMNDSLCSSDPATIGDMATMMAAPGMMDHMVEVHSTPGQFQWNGDGQCVFTPDAPMSPSMRYMIHLGPELAGMMGSGSMMGHRDGMSSEMTLHFTTADAASHGSHHGTAGVGE